MTAKTGRKLVPARNKKKVWSKEDEMYLEDSWGVKSIKTIAKNLGRSENAVIVRAQRLGCGAFLEAGDYITLQQILAELYGARNTSYARKRLIDHYGLPAKTKVVRHCRFLVVNIDDFWEWAEKNKSVLDFSRMEPLCFGEEPEWVKVKRDNDKRHSWDVVPHNTAWTANDDEKLRRMIGKKQYTYPEIAKELRRTEGAVKRRLLDLGISEKPVRLPNKKWTDQEVEMLLDMVDQDFTWAQIGKAIGRSALSVRGKYERIQNPNYMKRYNRGHSKDYDYVGIRDVSPSQIRKDMAAAKNNHFVEVDELPREEEKNDTYMRKLRQGI